MVRWITRGRVALLGLALCAAGCGGGTSVPPRTPTAAPTPTAPPTATPSAPAPSPTPSSASIEGWLTYHGNLARTGVDATSPPLSSPALAWRSPALDGPIWAEPLVDGGQVIVVTVGGSVYSLAAATGQVSWRTHVDDPISRSDLPCGNVNPLGILSTPVIDPATQTIFVVAETTSASHEMVALSEADGSILWRRSIDASAPGVVSLDQQQRAALALAGGRVLATFGGLDGDCGTYKGYVVSVPENGSGPTDTYILPVANQGGIWSPSGPSVDAAGDVFVASGNSEVGSSTTFDMSDSVIELTPTLQVEGYFAPTDWRYLSQTDLDLGSTGPMLFGSEILIAGKDGVLYLLNSTALGGIGGQAASLGLGSGSFGGLAEDGTTVFVPTVRNLDAVSVQGSTLRLAWQGPATWPAILSGGGVWAVTRSGGDLVALSAASGAQLYSLPLGSVEDFTTPTAFAGQLYVAAGDQIIAVSGV